MIGAPTELRSRCASRCTTAARWRRLRRSRAARIEPRGCCRTNPQGNQPTNPRSAAASPCGGCIENVGPGGESLVVAARGAKHSNDMGATAEFGAVVAVLEQEVAAGPRSPGRSTHPCRTRRTPSRESIELPAADDTIARNEDAATTRGLSARALQHSDKAPQLRWSKPAGTVIRRTRRTRPLQLWPCSATPASCLPRWCPPARMLKLGACHVERNNRECRVPLAGPTTS